MRKLTKRWEVSRHVHEKSGHEFVVSYDQSDKMFWARVGETDVEDQFEAEVVVKAIAEADRIWNPSPWERRLFVAVSSQVTQTTYGGLSRSDIFRSEEVSFQVMRAWVSVDARGNKLTRDWDLRHPERVSALWVPLKGNATDVPYTDELWEKFKTLNARIGGMRDELAAVLSDGRALMGLSGFLEDKS